MNTYIAPGSTIGIIGGGQLGRMMTIAAAQLGYATHVYTPEHNSPAQQVASRTTIADYANIPTLQTFAKSVDVLTYEFENIPHASLALLENTVTVSPSADILRLSQHREREKNFLNKHGIKTAPFMRVASVQDLVFAQKTLGNGILKTAELGYDGKGQIAIRSDTDLKNSWKLLNCNEAIYEAFIDFTCEISVIVARNAESGTVAYPPVQNIHTHHILDSTRVPAPISRSVHTNTLRIAKNIAEILDLQGLLAVEMFVNSQEEVLVNELAPRPHNSGHWTLDACVTSQFEQAIRAVCGLPLGSTRRLQKAVMKNLIGEEVHDWYHYLQNPNAKLHLYGKKEVRKGRKMGHVTILG